MTNIDDIDKEISFIEQKFQELKDESFNIHNASAKDKVKSDTHEPQTNKKPRDSGFVSDSSVIDSHGDVKPKTRSTAKVSWKDELMPGARSPYDKYDQDHFASTPLSQNEPESNITHRRKSGRLNDMNEDTRYLGDKKSHNKPATFDGTGSWLEYRSHFDACAMLNKWKEREKGLFLAVSLRGQAQCVLGNLPYAQKHDYALLVNAFEDRFSPANQNDLYRTQRAAETLPELGQSIRRLTNLAYPTALGDVTETLAKEQFIDALIDSDMRLRVKQARPLNLNDAIRHAVELEAFIKSDRKMLDAESHLRPLQTSKPESVKGKSSDYP